MKRYRLPLLLLPAFAAIALALALSLGAPRAADALGSSSCRASDPMLPQCGKVLSLVPAARHSSLLPDVRPLLTGTGALLKDSGLTIIATGPVITTDLNTTFLILNQPGVLYRTTTSGGAENGPSATATEDGSRGALLSLDFWSNDALVLHLPFTLTLEPGPNVFPVAWTTAAFSPSFDARADNLLVAQWADADGKVIDTALRSFSRFGADPLPSPAFDASVWNIGTITQGAVLAHVFTVANAGAADLAVYLPGYGFGQPYHRLVPGDMAAYTVTLDTLALSPAPYSHTLTVRTSDPALPTRTLLISGTILPPDAPAGVFAIPDRPWDRRVVVYGSVAENTSVYFSDFASPDMVAAEPCTVSDASGKTLKGVGRLCLDSSGSAFGANGWRVLLERLEEPLMRLSVPEDVSGGAAYITRFGRQYTFGDAGGVLTTPLHVTSQTYAAAVMDALVTNVAVWGPVSMQVMVGSVSIYSQTQVITQPTVIHLPDFAGAIGQVLATQTPGTAVDVPFQVMLDSAADVVLTNFSLVPARRVDISMGPGDVAFGPPVVGYTLTEGLTAPITALLHNSGASDSGPLVVSFYETPAELASETAVSAPTYIRSVVVSNVPAGGSAPATLAWDTSGLTGVISLTAIADPFDRVPASGASNHSAGAALTLLTRPAVSVARIVPANPQPYPNDVVPTAVVLRNSGQTDALSLTVALYEGGPSSTIDLPRLQSVGQARTGASPDLPRAANILGHALACALQGCGEAGSLIAAQYAPQVATTGTVLMDSLAVDVAAGAEVTATLQWTPPRAGARRLFAVISANHETPPPAGPDGQASLPAFVGFRGPILIDSGGVNDLAYTPAVGYGFLGAGSGVSRACGTESYRAFRQMTGGPLQYRIDNFHPARAYHLDLTFGECDGAGRQQRVLVNGTPVLGAVDLSDEQPHRFSLRLDPALYAGAVVTLTIDELNGRTALVSEIHVYDVDYRDAVAGSPSEQPYAASTASAASGGRRFGYLNGAPLAFDVEPGPTARMETGAGELRYRFDQLDPARRYALSLSFYHRFPLTPTLAVAVGNYYRSPEFTLPYSQPYAVNIAIPRGAYAADGSVTVSISRTDILTGAFVNEIALEEQTLGETLSSADLMVLALQSPRIITAGMPVTFTLLVINNGPDTAGDVVLNAAVPSGMRPAATASSGFCDGSAPLSCSLGAFSNGASAEVSLVLVPTAVGVLTIPIGIESATADPYSPNNSVLLLSQISPGAAP